MKILKIIHGYPMRYNAGSEVYSQTLCHALVAAGHEVDVFTREEDPFAPDYTMREEFDADELRIRLHLINMPRVRDDYRHAEVDQRVAELLARTQPDIVHIGHLNHLSTSLVAEVARREIPVIFTLHDYWLMCPRGQFMQMHPQNPDELWASCDGQDNRKCAERCYARNFSGAPAEREHDVAHWTDWVARRMKHVHEMSGLVDTFLAPSLYLKRRFQDEFALPAAKVRFLKYGFDTKRLEGRQRVPLEQFVFGYIGTHIPAKGIHVLIEAFASLLVTLGDSRQVLPLLRIWGRPRGQETEALKRLAIRLMPAKDDLVQWLPEYRNDLIIHDVFNHVDAIVVPSVWVENAPLVIQEALHANVPVITADVGGMAEYVHHEQNGLLFRHRDPADLAAQMRRLLTTPQLATELGQSRGTDAMQREAPQIDSHVQAILGIYRDAIQRRDSARIAKTQGPWRITFDTNPDDCNYACIMCEEHAPQSKLQIERREQGRPRRRMPIEVIRKMVAEQAPRGLREIIPSTMGEPLLYEDFDEILALCTQYNVKMNLTTNGSFPTRGAQKWAEQIVPVTSDVKISWNGATQATHEAIMLHSRWPEVLENVRTFIAVRDQHARTGGNRCRVTFQLTFLERNVAELADIVKLAAQLGVDRVKGHHLWVHGAEMADQSMRRSLLAIQRWNQAVLQAQRAAEQYRLPNGENVLLENIHTLAENASQDIAPGGKCPFLMQEAWVSAVGRFSPCCAPDAQRRALGEFGNLNDLSLDEIWQSETYANLAETYRTRPLCLGCNMKKPAAEQP